MSKILICGATSFVANGFAELLKQKGYEAETFSRDTSMSREGSKICGKYIEIHNNMNLAQEYHTVVNFAVLKDASIEDNIMYIKSLVKMCIEHNVKKLIHFSSIMVYNRHQQYINETTPIESSEKTFMKGYGLIKIATDEYLNTVRETLPFELIQVRPGYVLADGHPCPFVKHFFGGVNVILGNKKSTMPIVHREDIHKALIRITETENNLPVYLFYPNNSMTKYRYAKETVGGLILTLPKWIFNGVPHICAKLHLIPCSIYSRFEGMYTKVAYSSEQTENMLNMKFQ
jgi:nucleoside-diphosphate-sugar epimerase